MFQLCLIPFVYICFIVLPVVLLIVLPIELSLASPVVLPIVLPVCTGLCFRQCPATVCKLSEHSVAVSGRAGLVHLAWVGKHTPVPIGDNR